MHVNSKFLIYPAYISGGWRLCKGQEALQVHFVGTLPATCSQLPQPQDTPAQEPKAIRLQGCDTSPCHYGLRGVVIFLKCFYPIIWLALYWWVTFLWDLCFFFFNLMQLDPVLHRCIYVVWGGGIFPCGLLQSCISFLVLHSGSWWLILQVAACICWSEATHFSLTHIVLSCLIEVSFQSLRGCVSLGKKFICVHF